MANNLGGVYETGTITIAADKITVTGVGTFWASMLRKGDWILCNGQVGLIETVSDNTHLILQSDWQGTLPSAAAYVAIKMSWLRYEPALMQAQIRELLAELGEQGNFVFTEIAPPDPALGTDGQFALKTDVVPWRVWFKTGGVWVEQAAPGIVWKGAWSSVTTYNPNEAVQRLGSSYVSKTNNTNKPPEANAADWDLMASSGATSIGASSIEPNMLNSDTGAEQQAFRDRIVAAPVDSPSHTGNGTIAGNWTVNGGGGITALGGITLNTNPTLRLNGARSYYVDVNSTNFRIVDATAGLSRVEVNASGVLSVLANVGSSSTSSGSLVVVGGAGISGQLTVGATAQIGPNDGSTAQALLLLSGGSGNPGGGRLHFSQGGSNQWMMGHHKALYGGTSADFVLHNVAIGQTLGVEFGNNNATFFGSTFTIGSNNAAFIVNALSGNPTIYFQRTGAPYNNIWQDGTKFYISSWGDNSSGAYLANGTGSWASFSDARLTFKRNATDITDTLPSLQGFRLYENTNAGGQLEIFAKAQEMFELFPHVVDRGDDDPTYVPDRIDDPRMWNLFYDRLGAIALAYARRAETRLAAIEARLGE